MLLMNEIIDFGGRECVDWIIVKNIDIDELFDDGSDVGVNDMAVVSEGRCEFKVIGMIID